MAYQPNISLACGSLARVEALVRWDDPELGKIEPSRFVPLAEQLVCEVRTDETGTASDEQTHRHQPAGPGLRAETTK